MAPYIKSKILKLVYAILGIFFVIPALMGWLWIIFEEFDIYAFISAIICTIGMVVFYTLLFLEDAEVKLRYVIFTKNRDLQINESLSKFKNADKSFIDTFVKSRKKIYKNHGKIYVDDNNLWVYREKKGIEKATKLYKALLNSIKSKGGFVEFLHTVYDMDFDSGWQTQSYMMIDIASPELQYLIYDVFDFTDFCIEDSLISEKFTEKNNEIIEKLNSIYTPILFGFEDEVINIVSKLTTKANNSKDTKKPKTK